MCSNQEYAHRFCKSDGNAQVKELTPRMIERMFCGRSIPFGHSRERMPEAPILSEVLHHQAHMAIGIVLNNPQIVGFGISNNETFTQATQYAKGAIIGSAFIKYITNNDINSIESFINNIK